METAVAKTTLTFTHLFGASSKNAGSYISHNAALSIILVCNMQHYKVMHSNTSTKKENP